MNKGIKISIGLSLLMAAASSFAGAPAQVPVTGEVGGAAGSTKGVAWPSPRFVAGTGATVDCITDKLTGLMWPKNGIIGFSNGADPYTPLATPELNNTDATHSLVKWSSSGSTNEVFAAIANLNNATTKLCGYSDWRLPNKVELKSMINYGAANPATWLMYGTGSSGSLACDGACFANVQAFNYWSSSTFASGTDRAWVVNFSYGYVSAFNKTNVTYVWPVRGGQ